MTAGRWQFICDAALPRRPGRGAKQPKRCGWRAPVDGKRAARDCPQCGARVEPVLVRFASPRQRTLAGREQVAAALLEHPDWPDSRVGRHVLAQPWTVARVRRRLEAEGKLEPRSRPDTRTTVKRAAVERELRLDPGRADAWIARAAGCTSPVVRLVRAQLEAAGAIERAEVLRGEDGRKRRRTG